MKERKRKNIFRIYKVDKNLSDKIIDDCLGLDTDYIMPEIYMLLLESREYSNLDMLFDKYNTTLSISDVIEVEDKDGISKFYILDLFGFSEIEFDKSIIYTSLSDYSRKETV